MPEQSVQDLVDLAELRQNIFDLLIIPDSPLTVYNGTPGRHLGRWYLDQFWIEELNQSRDVQYYNNVPDDLMVLEIHIRESMVRWLTNEIGQGELSLSHDTRLSIRKCLMEEFKFLRLLRNLLLVVPKTRKTQDMQKFDKSDELDQIPKTQDIVHGAGLKKKLKGNESSQSSIDHNLQDIESNVKIDGNAQCSQPTKIITSAKPSYIGVSQLRDHLAPETLNFCETARLSILQPVNAQYFFPRWSIAKSGSMKLLCNDALQRVRIRMEYWDETCTEIYAADDLADLRKQLDGNCVVLLFSGLDCTEERCEEIKTFKIEFDNKQNADNFQSVYFDTRKDKRSTVRVQDTEKDCFDFNFEQKFSEKFNITEAKNEEECGTNCCNETRFHSCSGACTTQSNTAATSEFDVKVGSHHIHEDIRVRCCSKFSAGSQENVEVSNDPAELEEKRSADNEEQYNVPACNVDTKLEIND